MGRGKTDRVAWSLRRLLIVAAIGIGGAPAGTAQNLEYGGYVEHQIYPQELRGSLVVMDYSKLRLDVSTQLTDWLSASGDYIFSVQHGKRTFNSLDMIPREAVDAYAASVNLTSESLREAFVFRLKNENYIDNAFVSFYTDWLNIRAGRQQIPRGTGYVWNPTDIFHDKNQLDPTYEKRGVDVVKAEIPISGMSAITGVVGVEDGWNEATKSIRFRSHFSGFDFSISAVEKHEDQFDFNDFADRTARRRLIGADASGAIGGIGVWFEGAYNDVENSDSYSQILFGADYTLESGLYLIAEYYRNGKGVTDRSRYDLQRWMDLLGSAGENLGKNLMFVGQSFPLTDLLTGSNYVIVNMDDGSAVVYPYLEYSLSDNAVLTIIGYATIGRSDAEFGAFGSGAIVRGRLYF